MSLAIRYLPLVFAIAIFLIPSSVTAQTDEGWDAETVIDVSVVGNPVINLDSSNTLLRVYVDITNFDPADGYYFMRLTQTGTGTVISEEEIIIRDKGNGKAGADAAHLVSGDEIESGSMQGEYNILIYSEHGTAVGNAMFSIIKPSESPNMVLYDEDFEESTQEIGSTANTEPVPNETELDAAQKIPDWVKNIFVLYSNDSITENELINALTYLIDQGIIVINK